MFLFLRLRASIALISFVLLPYATHAEKLRITSTPPGAKIEINGVAVGTTPFEKDYPGGYFHKTKTLCPCGLTGISCTSNASPWRRA